MLNTYTKYGGSHSKYSVHQMERVGNADAAVEETGVAVVWLCNTPEDEIQSRESGIVHVLCLPFSFDCGVNAACHFLSLEFGRVVCP